MRHVAVVNAYTTLSVNRYINIPVHLMTFFFREVNHYEFLEGMLIPHVIQGRISSAKVQDSCSRW
ncbi:hypothetical protein Lysil_0839 [Lysobacter silvestris]|uniref:Uncharacterized protein n=1 Tax=Solilutibacter silvestris TaxID=1645665 RepID=A0A2K1Q2D3_9GAMM|nr:hypothetical protein Lysil_0839 [Lysobacter silvestris]